MHQSASPVARLDPCEGLTHRHAGKRQSGHKVGAGATKRQPCETTKCSSTSTISSKTRLGVLKLHRWLAPHLLINPREVGRGVVEYELDEQVPWRTRTGHQGVG